MRPETFWPQHSIAFMAGSDTQQSAVIAPPFRSHSTVAAKRGVRPPKECSLTFLIRKMQQLTPSQLLAEIEDAIRTAPSSSSSPDAIAWLGRSASLLKRWAPSNSIVIDSAARGALGISGMLASSNFSNLLMLLHEARHELRLNEVGPLSIAIDRGSVLDYFEEVRKLMATARSELFFVDPFLDAEFVYRYLPQIPSGVTVRLMGKKGMLALKPAVDLAGQQLSLNIELRSASTLHDRFLFIDGQRGFSSGASFKDGARLAPTIFTEITDALVGVKATYEQLWSRATVHI